MYDIKRYSFFIILYRGTRLDFSPLLSTERELVNAHICVARVFVWVCRTHGSVWRGVRRFERCIGEGGMVGEWSVVL